MSWTPSPSAVNATERLINLTSSMTNQANEEATALMATLVSTEVDLPCLLLEAFLSKSTYSTYAGALFKTCIIQSCTYIMAEGRQDILSRLFTRLAEALEICATMPYNSHAILASMVNTLIQHKGVGFIWPELETVLVGMVKKMQETYVALLSSGGGNVAMMQPFTPLVLLIGNISEDSVVILKDCKSLSLAIEMMVQTTLSNLSAYVSRTSLTADQIAVLDAFSSVFKLYKCLLLTPVPPLFSEDSTLLKQVFVIIGALCPTAITLDSEILQASLEVVIRTISMASDLYLQDEGFFSNVLSLFTHIMKELYQIIGTETSASYTGITLRSESTNVARLTMSVWHEFISDTSYYPKLRRHITPELILPTLNACILQEEELLFIQSSSVIATRDIGQISDLIGPWTNRKHALLLLEMFCEINKECVAAILQGCATMLASHDLSAIEAAITILAYASGHIKKEDVMDILLQIKSIVLDVLYAQLPDPLVFDSTIEQLSLNLQFSAALETSCRLFAFTEDYSQLLGAPAKGERVPLFISIIVAHSIYTLTKYIEAFDASTTLNIVSSLLKILAFSADPRIRYYITGGLETIVDMSVISSSNQEANEEEASIAFSLPKIGYEAILNTVCSIMLLDVRTKRVSPSELNFLVDLIVSCLMADTNQESTAVVAGVAEYDLSAMKNSSLCTTLILETIAEVFLALLPSYLPHVVNAATMLATQNTSDERICLAFTNLNSAISPLLGNFMQQSVGPHTASLQETIVTQLLPTYIDTSIKGLMLCLDNVGDATLWPDDTLLESLILFINDALLTGKKTALSILEYKSCSLVPALIQTFPIFTGTTLQAEILGMLGEVAKQYPNYLFPQREFVGALLDSLFDVMQNNFESKVQNNAIWLFGILVENQSLIKAIGLEAYASLFSYDEVSGPLGQHLKLHPHCPMPSFDLSQIQNVSQQQQVWCFSNYASLLLKFLMEETVTSDALINAAITLLKWTRSYLVIGRAMPMLSSRLLLLVAENLDTIALQACKSDDIDERDCCFIAIFMVALCMPDIVSEFNREICCALRETTKMCPLNNEEFDSILSVVRSANIIAGLEEELARIEYGVSGTH